MIRSSWLAALLLVSQVVTAQTITPGGSNTPGRLTVEPMQVGSLLFHDRSGFVVSDVGDFAGYDYVRGENNLKDLNQANVYFELTLAAPTMIYMLRAEAPERQWMLDMGFAASSQQGLANTTGTFDTVTQVLLPVGTHQFMGVQTNANNYTLAWIGVPQPCPYDASILDNDPLCVECQWVPGILESDAACVQPYVEDAVLNWDAPTENECGPETPTLPPEDPNYCPPLDDLAGYNVYYGNQSGGPYPDSMQVPGAVVTTTTVAALTEGDWYFVATAYDDAGNESAFSNEALKTIIAQALPCPWDGSIMDDDPLCVECQWVPGIIESDPLCVPPPTPCPWDASIPDTDPLCVECQYVPGILESDPLCVPPPLPCPWDASINANDPLCVECQWVPGILESDPLCVPPTGLTVIDNKAYVLQIVPDGWVLVYVGTVPIGTTCDENQELLGHHVVPTSQVSWAGTVETLAVVAMCQ